MPTVLYTGNANRYKLTGAGVTFEQGEAVTVSESTAEYVLEREDFEAVEGAVDETVQEEDGPPDDEVAPPIDPGDYTVSELEGELDDSDFSDAELAAIGTAEANGQNRTGVRGAIDAHRED
jgi:hypothetical protein